MLKITEILRNEIVVYLKSIDVKAEIGANLIQITNALVSLETIEPEIKTEEPIAEKPEEKVS